MSPPASPPSPERAQGECLVLLRGLTRESAHWDGFAERAERAIGLPAFAIDLPGFGRERSSRSPASARAIALACEGSSAWRAAPARKHVLGQSLGAMAAAELARAFPAQVASILLVNGSARQLGFPWERFGSEAWGCAAKAARHFQRPTVASAMALESAIHRATCEDSSRAGADLELWARIRRQRPGSAADSVRQLLAAARFRAPDAAPARAMAACSARDKVASPECSRRLARLWGCPLAEHPWAGHDLAHDDPEWLLSIWSGFLAAR